MHIISEGSETHIIWIPQWFLKPKYETFWYKEIFLRVMAVKHENEQSKKGDIFSSAQMLLKWFFIEL